MNTQNSDTRWWRRATMVGLLGTTLLAGACVDGKNKEPDPTYSTTQYSLEPVENCDQLQNRVEDVLVEDILKSRYSDYGFVGNNAVDATSGDSGTRGSESESPDDYTTTNVQEEGVDEVDIVKTDGNHIYLAHQGEVVILKSWPAEQTEELARVTIGQDSYSQGLFLHEDRLLAMSSIWENTRDGQNNFSGTRITVIDISDRANPEIERRIDIEGWANDARMIDGDVYIVSNTGLRLGQDYWNLVWDDLDGELPEPEWDASEERQAELREEARPKVRRTVREYLNQHDIEEMLPRKRFIAADGSEATSQMYQCSDIYLSPVLAQTGVLNLTHVDLADSGKPSVDSTGVMANGWEVYASRDNLYVAMTSRWWWWGWGDQDNETHIHKFGLRGPDGDPEYVASGKVDGWLLNQFSMSEHKGYLRVATTDNEFTWNEATEEREVEGGNHLTILEQDDAALVETGSVRDLAPGERIYSARMMGDRGYLVTFRQTDPLFTFDLSDPNNPKLEGELKINGFSSYMHPLGDDHLLTIGQDATDEGRVTGVHLQIFDVSDMKNPTRAYQEKITTGSWSSWSEAMWDHHAFTYHDDKGILAFPINIHEWDREDGENFSGLLVYRATAESGFSEMGRVNHSDLVQQYWCDEAQTTECDDYRASWWTSVRRSIFMEDYLFSISDVGVKVNDLQAPGTEYTSVMLRK